mmetsp:Transcript_88743/g.255947  ORF Transcript_88743/g.255947 Transcript_88743/m.255947 type:complete len:84 (-) Transcript_88743:940-1191(-)
MVTKMILYGKSQLASTVYEKRFRIVCRTGWDHEQLQENKLTTNGRQEQEVKERHTKRQVLKMYLHTMDNSMVCHHHFSVLELH